MWISNIILVTFLLSLCVLYISWVIRSDSNEKWKCKKCGVVSRRGIWDLYNSKLIHEHTYERCCPVCEEFAQFEKVYTSTPLAPRLNTVKCLRINIAIDKNQDSMQADEQLDAYLKVQNKKLEQMKLTKDSQ